MNLLELLEALDREQTLAEHYHLNSQTWKLAVCLAKIQDLARKAEWECNGLIYGKQADPYESDKEGDSYDDTPEVSSR